MDEKIKHFVEEIKSYLIGIYKERIKQVILYGSYARGDATEDSDIDLLVVVEDGLDPLEVEESLSDLLFEILLGKGELVSVMAIPEGTFRSYNSPLFLNVKEEGISV
ncbi:MAG: nucleotidyltransferase domain-containing protein [Halobacteriota archaeon]|nr:nucleotidyltransferase domain-containing protein [Halobacteriota archaeon]